MCVCLGVCMRVCMGVCMRVCIGVCMRVWMGCMYGCMYTDIDQPVHILVDGGMAVTRLS